MLRYQSRGEVLFHNRGILVFSRGSGLQGSTFSVFEVELQRLLHRLKLALPTEIERNTMERMTVRFGLAVVASPLEVGAEEAPNLLKNAQEFFDGTRVELHPYGAPVISVQEAIRAGMFFYDKRVHAICTIAASWFEDYLVLDMLEECDVPVVLWARPGMETGSLCGTQQLGFMLRQLSKPYKMLYDELESQTAREKLFSFASAAALRYCLRRARIGYIGHRVEGMTETTGHELAMKKLFGPRIVSIDTQVLLKRASQVEDEAVRDKWEELKRHVGKVTCDDQAGMESLKFHRALKSLIEEKMLNAVAVGCYPYLMGKVCLAASLLGEERVPLACEGDVNGALGMLMLTLLSGNPTHNTDLLDPIPEDNAIVFSHCGSGAFSLAEDPSRVTLAPVRLVDRGLCCLFPAKLGPVTLVNLVPTLDGYKMGVLFGEAVRTGMVFPGNPLKVRFESHSRDVLFWIAKEGLGHHWMAAYGDFRVQLADFAGMVGCELTQKV